MVLAVFGATGLVGSKMLEVLEERSFPVTELLPIASAQSLGKQVHFQGRDWTILSPEAALARSPHLALFSAGTGLSLEWAPRFAAAGCTVIDNSSAWRMHPDVPLVVPEINMQAVRPEQRIIANPNCSTIQMVLALHRLHARYRIRRIVVSTYQSVTGSGQKGIRQLLSERQAAIQPSPSTMHPSPSTVQPSQQPPDPTQRLAYPHPIDLNLIPHIDSFLDDGYTKEEMKMLHETRKILSDAEIAVSPTAVRVPVMGGHSESINVSFHEDFAIEDVLDLLRCSPGVVLEELPHYPIPKDCFGRDEVFVGRVRRDPSDPNTLNMWIVADNLRKGAATNAVQIAENYVNRRD
jgi:aspartate-semialdehyde dehydrogenase (peptidoglycan organisms)